MTSCRTIAQPRLLFMALASMAAVSSFAADVGYHFTAGVAQSDNIARTPADEKSESIGSAGVDFSVVQHSRRLDIDTEADLSWLDYLDDTYDDRLSGNFQGLVRADLVPQWLVWTLQENFGQGRLDPLAAVTPDNLENINYFTTGPDFSLRIGADNRLRLAGRYSRTDYETSPLDSNRYSGAAGLVHLISSAASASLNVQREHIDFNAGTADQDYDRDQAYLNYEVAGRRTRITADAGYSRLERSSGSSDGVVVRLDVSREISASSVVSLAAGREYSDASDDFRFSQAIGAGGAESQASLQTSEPFTSQYARAGWEFNRRRTALGFDIGRYDDSYEVNNALDRSRLVANAHFGRSLTPQTRALLAGYYSKEDFDTLDGDSRETGANAELTRRFGRMVSIGLRYQYLRRSSDLPASEFTENRLWLNFSYGKDAPRRTRGFADEPRPRE